MLDPHIGDLTQREMLGGQTLFTAGQVAYLHTLQNGLVLGSQHNLHRLIFPTRRAHPHRTRGRPGKRTVAPDLPAPFAPPDAQRGGCARYTITVIGSIQYARGQGEGHAPERSACLCLQPQLDRGLFQARRRQGEPQHRLFARLKVHRFLALFPHKGRQPRGSVSLPSEVACEIPCATRIEFQAQRAHFQRAVGHSRKQHEASANHHRPLRVLKGSLQPIVAHLERAVVCPHQADKEARGGEQRAGQLQTVFATPAYLPHDAPLALALPLRHHC
jgi:hypothetical protein